MPMRVLAVDPGYDRLGVAVLEKGKNNIEHLVYSDCITSSKKDNLPDRLYSIGQAFSDLLDTYQVDMVAIETLFSNYNKKTVIGVAEARGLIIYLAKKAGCQVSEFGPQEIKVAVTGYGKSDKRAVMKMTKRLVDPAPEKGLDDEYDAIAVGLTALAHYR